MYIHLYATDKSVFSLLKSISNRKDINVTAIVIPENRLNSEKVRNLIGNREGVPVHIQTKENWSLDGLPSADMAISWFYSQILPLDILDAYPYGILNMHGGKIPQYRGANVLQWAIINGESELGVTWHTMVEKVDAGPIWAEYFIPILPEYNALDLRKLLIKEAVRTFLSAYKDCINPEKNGKIPDLTKGKYWPPRKPEDGRISPGMTVRQVKDLIRALPDPWPGATVKVNGHWKRVTRVSEEFVKGWFPYCGENGVTMYLQFLEDSFNN